MNALIQFRPDGTGITLATDLIPLQSIGRLDTTRASSIEFNRARQQWEVRFTKNPKRVVYRNASRTACIDWEVKKLSKKLMR